MLGTGEITEADTVNCIWRIIVQSPDQFSAANRPYGPLCVS
jgi:hypothetical protein